LRQEYDLEYRIASREPQNTPEVHRIKPATSNPVGTPPRKESDEPLHRRTPNTVEIDESSVECGSPREGLNESRSRRESQDSCGQIPPEVIESPRERERKVRESVDIPNENLSNVSPKGKGRRLSESSSPKTVEDSAGSRHSFDFNYTGTADSTENENPPIITISPPAVNFTEEPIIISPKLASVLTGQRTSSTLMREETITPEDAEETQKRIEFFSYIDHDIPPSEELSRESTPEPEIVPDALEFFKKRSESKADIAALCVDWGSVEDAVDDVSDDFEETAVKSRPEVVLTEDPEPIKKRDTKKRVSRFAVSVEDKRPNPSFNNTKLTFWIMEKRRAREKAKRKAQRPTHRRQKLERKLGPRDIGRKSKKSYQAPDYDVYTPQNSLAPRISSTRNNQNERIRKLGPRDIGRKSKDSFAEPGYDMRKESVGIYNPRVKKTSRPSKAVPRKLGPREIGRKSKRSFVMPKYS